MKGSQAQAIMGPSPTLSKSKAIRHPSHSPSPSHHGALPHTHQVKASKRVPVSSEGEQPRKQGTCVALQAVAGRCVGRHVVRAAQYAGRMRCAAGSSGQVWGGMW